MTQTRIDRLYDALATGDLELVAAPDDLAAALEHAGLVLRDAANPGDANIIPFDAPISVDERIRASAVAFALQMRNIAERDTDFMLKDAEKIRAFLAGES